MSLKPFHKIVEVRPDVRDGTLDQSAYAASMGDVAGVIDKPAAKQYRDPVLFDQMTYETDSLRRVLEDIRVRLHEGRGNGLRQIETSFGGGKTHAMIAMYHRCRQWDAIPIVIDGQTLDVSDTVWGEIEQQLDKRVSMMVGQTAPSGTRIYDLLSNRKKPILILIDEIFNYIVNASGVSVGNSDLAAQTVNFIQRLAGQLGGLPNVCLIMSLSDKDDVLSELGIEGKVSKQTAKYQNKYYAMLQNIVGRQRQLVTISDEGDIPHIVRRRLFDTDEAIITERSKDIIQHCVDKMKDGGSLFGDEIRDYMEQFCNTYPFTPDIIKVLHERWGSYPTFQRTRGVLRLLSLVVHSMLESDREWIAPGDIDLSVSSIRKELLKHTGENTESVITADIIGKNAGARSEEEVGIRCASAIFMYSFPLSYKGATQAEVKRAAFMMDTPHSVVGDTVGKLRRRLIYLELTYDDMFRFAGAPNMNHTIDQTVQNVSDIEVEQEELKRLQRAVPGGKFANVVVWPDAIESGSVKDMDRIQLVICKNNNPEWCKNTVNGPVQSRRINMNGLVFLLPSNGAILDESLRRYLAMISIRNRLGSTRDWTPPVADRVNDELNRAKQGIGDGLRKKYSVIYLPGGGGVKQHEDYTFNPKQDGDSPLDHIVWDRLVNDDQITTHIEPDIAREYGDDPDSVYEVLIRTPGNVMPASPSVLYNAFAEPKRGSKKKETESNKVKGKETKPEKEWKPEKEKVYESMTYIDKVDASGLNVIRSLLLEPTKIDLKHLKCGVEMRPDGRFDVHLEMQGKIPDRVIQGTNVTRDGRLEIEEGWDE